MYGNCGVCRIATPVLVNPVRAELSETIATLLMRIVNCKMG